MPSRRLSCSARVRLAAGLLRADTGALVAQQQRDGLEPRAYRGRGPAVAQRCLDVSDGAARAPTSRRRRRGRFAGSAGRYWRALVWGWPRRATYSSYGHPARQRGAVAQTVLRSISGRRGERRSPVSTRDPRPRKIGAAGANRFAQRERAVPAPHRLEPPSCDERPPRPHPLIVAPRGRIGSAVSSTAD